MSARSDLKEAKARIAKARAEGATRLDLSDLRGLEKLPEEIGTLTALTSLNLMNTKVSDITALAGLGALTSLNLRGTQVSDITVLAGLTVLTSLDLSGAQVSDITALAGLGALTSLDLMNTPVSAITALAGLGALTSLSLWGTTVTDLRPLRGLQALATKPEFGGLTFTDCAAAKADPRIAEIADIKDPATRARELFAYLEDWVPPGANPYAPAPRDQAPASLPRQPRHTTADQIALLLRFSAATRLSASALAGQIGLLLRDAPNEPGTNHILADLQVFVDLQDALNGIAEVAATHRNSESDELRHMADKVAAYEAAIERLVSKLDAAMAENANLRTELAEALKRAETAESADGKPIFWPKYKESLGAGLAELAVWAGKGGLLTGTLYFLGNTPAVTRLLAILEKLP